MLMLFFFPIQRGKGERNAYAYLVYAFVCFVFVFSCQSDLLTIVNYLSMLT